MRAAAIFETATKRLLFTASIMPCVLWGWWGVVVCFVGEGEKKHWKAKRREKEMKNLWKATWYMLSLCADKKPHLSLAQKQQINKIKSWDSDVFCSDKLDQTAELHVDLTDTRCYAWSDATMFISLCDTCQSLSFALKGLHLKGNKLKADSCAIIQVHSSLKVVRN